MPGARLHPHRREDEGAVRTSPEWSADGKSVYVSRNRIRLAVFILGAGTSFGLAFLLEGLRNRRAAAPGGSKSDDATAADDDAVSLVEV